jgi:hypothetical protein
LRDLDHMHTRLFGSHCQSYSQEARMRKLTILAIACLLGAALSANAAERRHGALPHKTHQTQKQAEPEPEKPAVTRLPVSPDTFRA